MKHVWKNTMLLGLLLAATMFAAESADKSASPALADQMASVDKKLSELAVNADSMTFSTDKHLINLDGNVLIEDETMTLTSKKMVVHLDKDNKLSNIEALDGVTVRKKKTSESATGDTGFYDVATDQVTLRGNCIVIQGKNTMTGDVIVYDRAKGTIQAKRAAISIQMKKSDKDGVGGVDFLKK